MKRNLWHRIIFIILRYTAGPLLKWVMRYSCTKQKGPDVPSLIVSNHSTDIDPALVALGFSRHMYYLASEHAFRNGFPSKVLKNVFDPIPFQKARADVYAIKETIRRLRAGSNVCIFPEGDRTFTGTTAPIAASIAKLAKTCGTDLITFRIEGGFFTWPRWTKSLRRGKMTGRTVGRYFAAELKEMTEKQVLDLIERDLFEDAYARQKEIPTRYHGKNLAESIETALFLCPGCKRLGTIRSEGSRFFCECGLRGEYLETGFLEGEPLPFSTTTEWGDWQMTHLPEIVKNSGDGPICSDENQKLFEVNPAVGSKLIGEGTLEISRDSLRCAGMSFPMEHLTRIIVTGQMTLAFAVVDGAAYEVRSDVPRSALKYKEIYRILAEKTEDGKFL